MTPEEAVKIIDEIKADKGVLKRPPGPQCEGRRHGCEPIDVGPQTCLVGDDSWRGDEDTRMRKDNALSSSP